MAVEFCELLKDEHFLFKVITGVANFYGTKYLFRYGLFRNIYHMTILCLAFPASFLAMSQLMYLYRKGKKDFNIELLMLITYGTMNSMATYVVWLKAKPYITCPGSCFTTLNCMLMNAAIATLAIALELFMYICGPADKGPGCEDE